MKTIDVWRIVTLPEAAKRAKVEAGALRQYVHRHDDFPRPFLQLGKVNLYDWLAISDWLQTNAPYGRVVFKEETIEILRQKARETYYRSRGLPMPAAVEVDPSQQVRPEKFQSATSS